MASTTTNIGLTKPAGTDQALISAINGNMDIIDTKMGAVGNTSVQGQINALSDQIESQTITVSSLANFESQLNTLISTMTDGQTKDIIYSPASAFSPFREICPLNQQLLIVVPTTSTFPINMRLNYT